MVKQIELKVSVNTVVFFGYTKEIASVALYVYICTC